MMFNKILYVKAVALDCNIIFSNTVGVLDLHGSFFRLVFSIQENLVVIMRKVIYRWRYFFWHPGMTAGVKYRIWSKKCFLSIFFFDLWVLWVFTDLKFRRHWYDEKILCLRCGIHREISKVWLIRFRNGKVKWLGI